MSIKPMKFREAFGFGVAETFRQHALNGAARRIRSIQTSESDATEPGTGGHLHLSRYLLDAALENERELRSGEAGIELPKVVDPRQQKLDRFYASWPAKLFPWLKKAEVTVLESKAPRSFSDY